jgi:RNA polymerase sigma factor (sigma-70 family)
MAGRSVRADVLSELNSLTHVGVVANLSDTQLLDQFVAGGGEGAEAAFQALVTRHGRMVLGVCGNILHDAEDVEDSFQATFLVLALRARAIRRQNALAGWLLVIARRVALRCRADLARRRVHERRAAQAKASDEPSPPESWPELHEEIGRLPQRYREPVVLCYLEGLSTEAAAMRLGCPKGTVLSRLSRARERLRARLARRGLQLQAGMIPAVLSPLAMQVTIPPGLFAETVRASLRFSDQLSTAGGASSTTAARLARGVIYTMMSTKTKTIVAAVLTGLITVGALHTFARQQGGPAQPKKTQVVHQQGEFHSPAQLRLDAARRAFEMSIKDFIAGRLTDMEVLYRWSRRWMDGEFAASKTKAERISAAEAHLKRMKDLEKAAPELKKVADFFPASAEAAATYYRLEAEGLLDEARR